MSTNPVATYFKLSDSKWHSLTAGQRRAYTNSYNDAQFKAGKTTRENIFFPNGSTQFPRQLNYTQWKQAEAAYNKMYNIHTGPVSKSKTSTQTPPTSTPFKGAYVFNAPMIKNAYLNPTGSLKAHSLYGFVDTAVYQDALKAWGDGKGAKGAFQMDRSLNTTTNIANLAKIANTAISGLNYTPTPIDPTMYGFKFLYNPTTIDMSWGAVMAANPQYEALNLDVINPISSNLLNSTISFDIILNRIEDMNYLNSDGSYASSVDYIQDSENVIFQAQSALDNLGVQTQLTNSFKPYTEEVSISDRKEIYNKGTMYDLDYLFKTLHGFDGQGTRTTTLMGDTSDQGWLPVIPVELHLGNKMHYRVRVSSLSVHHSIFNTRMVPVLSTVSFTCNRYYDNSVPTTPKKK